MNTLTAPLHPVARARQDWRDRLAELPDVAEFLAASRARQLASGLTINDEPAMEVAAPELLTAGQLGADQMVISAVAESLIAAGQLALAEDKLRQHYLADWAVDPAVADLMVLDSGYPEEMVVGRFDGSRGPDGLSILEYNGGLPGGLMPTEGAVAELRTWPFFDTWATEHGASAFDSTAITLRGLVRTWHDFGGSGTPWVVLVTPKELHSYVVRGAAHLSRVAAREGIEFSVAEPSELTFAAGKLTIADRPVDVVLRGFFTPMIGALGDRLDALKAGLRAGSVCMVSSLRAGLYGHKALFALVTDPNIALPVAPDTLAIARAHMPWTRMMAAGTATSAEGDLVDIPDYALSDQANLVLKPAAGFGGAGVVLGWETSAAQWSEAVTKALAAGGHVLQQRLHLPEVVFPTLAPGFPDRTFIADSNPMIVNRKISGYFLRLSSTGGITNTADGTGSIAATFVLPVE